MGSQALRAVQECVHGQGGCATTLCQLQAQSAHPLRDGDRGLTWLLPCPDFSSPALAWCYLGMLLGREEPFSTTPVATLTLALSAAVPGTDSRQLLLPAWAFIYLLPTLSIFPPGNPSGQRGRPQTGAESLNLTHTPLGPHVWPQCHKSAPAKQRGSTLVKGCRDSRTFIRLLQHSWKK